MPGRGGTPSEPKAYRVPPRDLPHWGAGSPVGIAPAAAQHQHPGLERRTAAEQVSQREGLQLSTVGVSVAIQDDLILLRQNRVAKQHGVGGRLTVT